MVSHVCFDLGLHRSLEKSVMSNLKNSGGGFPSRNMVCEKIDFFDCSKKLEFSAVIACHFWTSMACWKV